MQLYLCKSIDRLGTLATPATRHFVNAIIRPSLGGIGFKLIVAPGRCDPRWVTRAESDYDLGLVIIMAELSLFSSRSC